MRWQTVCFSLILFYTTEGFYFKVSHQTAQVQISDYEESEFQLDTGDIGFYTNGTSYKQSKNDFVLTESGAFSGDDLLGEYEGFSWTTKVVNKTILLSVKFYKTLGLTLFSQKYPEGLPNTGQNVTNKVSTNWPSIVLPESSKNMKFRQLCDDMAGWNGFRTGDFDDNNIAGDKVNNLCDGVLAGPIFVTRNDELENPDKVLKDQLAVVSSFSNFMVHNFQVDEKQLKCGVFSNATGLPEGFELETMVLISGRKIIENIDEIETEDAQAEITYTSLTAGIQKWGEILTTTYEKTEEMRQSDRISQYLSYYTDRGAFYYYNNQTFQCDPTDCKMDDTIVWLTENFEKLDLPVRSIQYDSWRYTKSKASNNMDGDLGTVDWDARDDVFPMGQIDLFQKTGMPASAHNRVWADTNRYKSEKLGNWECDWKSGYCVPYTWDFWDAFFRNSTKWGLKIYEQDWMNEQHLQLEQIQNNVTLGRDWLLSMNRGAKNNDINIQMCMTLPRQMMQSLEMSQVTEIRVSEDYFPGMSLVGDVDNLHQYSIGFVSLVVHSLGLNPFKDTFWSWDFEQNNTYQYDSQYETVDHTNYIPNTDEPYSCDPKNGKTENCNSDPYEPFPEVQLVVSVLSTGPVGPGDKIQSQTVDFGNGNLRYDEVSMNIDLLKMCCAADGKILKPDMPASPTDYEVMNSLIGWEEGVPGGLFWRTKSKMNVQNAESCSISSNTWGYVLTVNQTGNFDIEFNRLLLDSESYYIKTSFSTNTTVYNQLVENVSGKVRFPSHVCNVDSQDLGPLGCQTMRLYTIAPVINTGSGKFSLIGEKNKIVPMSKQRVEKVEINQDSIKVSVFGSVGENVTFYGVDLVDNVEFEVSKVLEAENDVIEFWFGGGLTTVDPENGTTESGSWFCGFLIRLVVLTFLIN